MATKITKTKKYLIWGSILLVAGIAVYVILKKRKNKKIFGVSNNPFPFTKDDEVNYFRSWVITQSPSYAKTIGLNPEGKLDSSVQKAWEKYFAEYALVYAQNKMFKNMNNKGKADYIFSKCQDAGATDVSKNFIESQPTGFLDAWYQFITFERGTQGTFVYNNETYYGWSGKKVLNYNPLVTNYKINKDTLIYENVSASKKFIKSASDTTIGKPDYVKYDEDNIVWCRFPGLAGFSYPDINETNLIKV